jgi:hypothetical protein
VTELDDAASTTGTFTEDATGLTAITGYSFAAFAINSVDTAYSSVATFSTGVLDQHEETSDGSLPMSSYTAVVFTAGLSGALTTARIQFQWSGRIPLGSSRSGSSTSPAACPRP